MKNNIASFEKSSSSLVTICEKIYVEFIFALGFAQIFNLITARFLKRSNIISHLFASS